MTSKNRILIAIIALIVAIWVGRVFYFNIQKTSDNKEPITEKAYIAVEGGMTVAVLNMDNKK
ncbi:MAG: hypothetical protein AAB906_01950, partial [Patescibacteria group bacterium]